MSLQQPVNTYDPLVTISDMSAIQQLGDAALLGNWFVFLKAQWLGRSGMAQLLAASGLPEQSARPIVLFRGKETLTLPGAKIAPTALPRPNLVSLTCDKALYRVGRDTVRVLIAAPQHARAELRVVVMLSGNPYADYPVTLDEHGLYLWSLRDLPEGEYVVRLQGMAADECRFEVAEYRLAALNAELVEQQASGNTLRYVLSVTAFQQPYTGSVEVELQVGGQRIGERTKLRCDSEGRCQGTIKLAGDGMHTLSVIAGERTATVVLKGAEQQRRETLTISELGETRLLSMLPLPQSNTCRGMYISRGGSNTEPFLVRRVIGAEVEIIARTAIELVRTVVVDPARGTSEEQYHEQVKAEQVLRLPIPQPYGVVLLGAFVDGEAWEGWCAVLHPSDIRLECEVAKEAKPGSRIAITIKTGQAQRAIPVQVIVKDQRLIAPSDPQVELAAAIKKNLSEWQKSVETGKVGRQLLNMQPPMYARAYAVGGPMLPPPMPPIATMPFAAPTGSPQPQTAPARGMSPLQRFIPRITGQMAAVSAAPMAQQEAAVVAASAPSAAPVAQLTKVRMQFPEIIHNSIVTVRGEETIEVTLGDSLTVYTIEAFALSAETLDWQRSETTIQAVQAVYGELTVSPFVFPGDPVLGRLDVGAASGGVIAEVRHEDEAVPLFLENGKPVTPGLPIPSGSVLRFPVRPGMITALVRDARKGGADVSERYVTAPGQLRHVMRRTRLLNPGDEVTLQEGVLELKPMPGLERPFQAFVEGVAMYPYGCIEQTSAKFLAMYTGYITNQDNAEVAKEYEAALVVWYKRLQSMYLPGSGFCFYPPAEGGARKPDSHYAPLAVKRLLGLPTAEHGGLKRRSVQEMLSSVHTMAQDAAAYYKIDSPPKNIADCHAAYQVMISEKAKPHEKAKAAAFVRSRLKDHHGQMYVEVPRNQASYQLWDTSVATREETAYAAAALFATKEPADLSRAIAVTNYITSQMNEENRLYSTVDSAAALSLLIELRHTGLVTNGNAGKVLLNGREYALGEALSYDGKVESLRCVDGLIAVQVTSEMMENWSTYKGQLAVQVRLEKKGHVQHRFRVGDELELAIKVPQYEPGLIAHVCLPDALARIVGGGQVKRFSLDFCEKNELRVPLAAISSTSLPHGGDAATQRALLDWFAVDGKRKEQERRDGQSVQHWAVIVRNMFREEQIGNPGLLEVMVEA